VARRVRVLLREVRKIVQVAAVLVVGGRCAAVLGEQRELMSDYFESHQ
jgi:hypothetical protein